MGILQVFTLLGALGMFLYGMNLMSSGLQKAAGDKLRSFLSAMTSNPLKGVLTDIANAYNAEDRLNSLRNNFRDAMIEDIENSNTNYQASVYYMDIINQYERMGDFMINISQDLERAFVKR